MIESSVHVHVHMKRMKNRKKIVVSYKLIWLGVVKRHCGISVRVLVRNVFYLDSGYGIS